MLPLQARHLHPELGDIGKEIERLGIGKRLAVLDRAAVDDITHRRGRLGFLESKYHITQRVRDQAEVALRSERRTSMLYALSRELSQIQDKTELVRAAGRQIEQIFEGGVSISEESDAGLSTGFGIGNRLETQLDRFDVVTSPGRSENVA